MLGRGDQRSGPDLSILPNRHAAMSKDLTEGIDGNSILYLDPAFRTRPYVHAFLQETIAPDTDVSGIHNASMRLDDRPCSDAASNVAVVCRRHSDAKQAQELKGIPLDDRH